MDVARTDDGHNHRRHLRVPHHRSSEKSRSERENDAGGSRSTARTQRRLARTVAKQIPASGTRCDKQTFPERSITHTHPQLRKRGTTTWVAIKKAEERKECLFYNTLRVSSLLSTSPPKRSRLRLPVLMCSQALGRPLNEGAGAGGDGDAEPWEGESQRGNFFAGFGNKAYSARRGWGLRKTGGVVNAGKGGAGAARTRGCCV